MRLRVLALAFSLTSVLAIGQTQSVPISVNGRVPLGIESFKLEPANHEFYLMASAENPEFVGLRRLVQKEHHDSLVASDGKVLKFYPQQVQFRLTASTREKLLDDHPFGTESNLPLNQLLVKLRFRVKVFHGLAYRYIQPAYVQDVGMPPRLPSDERIYRIGFDLGKIPIEDRIVMEVLTPSGTRLCKFHLDIL